MDENNKLKEVLKNLADAIRFARYGNESGELINPQDFGVEIFSIADKYLSNGMIDNNGAGLNGITKLEFDGKLIQSIDSDAFKEMKSITELVFVNRENEDEKIKSIAKNAFFGCTGLTSLYIPDSINFIGQNAFCACINMSDVSIEEGLQKIEFGVFQGCRELERVFLPQSVKEISDVAFWGSRNMTIHAPAGSYAETYAKEHNIPFVAE